MDLWNLSIHTSLGSLARGAADGLLVFEPCCSHVSRHYSFFGPLTGILSSLDLHLMQSWYPRPWAASGVPYNCRCVVWLSVFFALLVVVAHLLASCLCKSGTFVFYIRALRSNFV